MARNNQLDAARKDAYSLVFFNHEPSTSVEGNLTRSPEERLTARHGIHTCSWEDTDYH